MTIESIELCNFKSFRHCIFNLSGKSVLLFGINGVGKSTVLGAINYLFRLFLNQINPNQSRTFESFTDEMIFDGEEGLEISGKINLEDITVELARSYHRSIKNNRYPSVTYSKGNYKHFKEEFLKRYLSPEAEMTGMPIFVYYGTNRAVLDIPDRIRTRHDFDKLSAIDRVMDQKLDFRTFFEWYRDQEALEVIEAREHKNYDYQDPGLAAVRYAIETMLGDVKNLRVKRNPVRMVVDKGDLEVRVDMLSDGEKCTLALLGDLTRRLVLANPYSQNILEGEGIVLIDEVELHMHPEWQRRILSVLKKLFPNIQFIMTTHSPQVLGEADESYRIFMLDKIEAPYVTVIDRMDGFDTNMILEEYMATPSKSKVKSDLLEGINQAIFVKDYPYAEQMLNELEKLSGRCDAEYILLSDYLLRSQIRDENNRKKART